MNFPRTVVLLIGLPGSGKTTLAKRLQEYMGCPWFNADKVRATLSEDLDFSEKSRLLQARRMAQICALTLEYETSNLVIADFVCPTRAMRTLFHSSLRFPSEILRGKQTNVDILDLLTPPRVFTVFMNTIETHDSRFKDTAVMFEAPTKDEFNLRIDSFPKNNEARHDLVSFIAGNLISSSTPGRIYDYPLGLTFDGTRVCNG